MTDTWHTCTMPYAYINFISNYKCLITLDDKRIYYPRKYIRILEPNQTVSVKFTEKTKVFLVGLGGEKKLLMSLLLAAKAKDNDISI